jgi:hypothetical protein
MYPICIVRAAGGVWDIAFQLAQSQELAPSAPTKRVGLGGSAKIYAGETSIWAAGAGKGGAGGGAARWRGERAGRGAGRKRRGWWAGRGLRTWAERPNAEPHVGRKKQKQNTGPVFLKKKHRTWDSVWFSVPWWCRVGHHHVPAKCAKGHPRKCPGSIPNPKSGSEIATALAIDIDTHTKKCSGTECERSEGSTFV